MATAVKTPVPLADSLSQRAPDPSEDYLSTLGLNRRSGYVQDTDPYFVGNMPGSHVAKAVSREQLHVARQAGWIPFAPDQVTRNEYDTSRAYLRDYDTADGFVVIGYGRAQMVMCYANRALQEAQDKASKKRWNAQLGSLGRENARVVPRDDKEERYQGGFTSDEGNQFAVGLTEASELIDLGDTNDDLFRKVEGN